ERPGTPRGATRRPCGGCTRAPAVRRMAVAVARDPLVRPATAAWPVLDGRFGQAPDRRAPTSADRAPGAPRPRHRAADHRTDHSSRRSTRRQRVGAARRARTTDRRGRPRARGSGESDDRVVRRGAGTVASGATVVPVRRVGGLNPRSGAFPWYHPYGWAPRENRQVDPRFPFPAGREYVRWEPRAGARDGGEDAPGLQAARRKTEETVALPQLTEEQRAAALEKAAAARRARAELKDRLKRG